MKRVILISTLAIIIFSCTKSKNNSNPQDYVHFTQSQIWDSIGFKYETKYLIRKSGNTDYNDTVIFHADNTITELYIHDTIRFSTPFYGVDTAIHYVSDPAGVYGRQLLLYFIPKVDTIYYKANNAYALDFFLSANVDTIKISKQQGYWSAYQDTVYDGSQFNIIN